MISDHVNSPITTSGFPILQRMQSYRSEGRHTDITITVDGQPFPAHRIFLEDASPVLKYVLSQNSVNDSYQLDSDFVNPEIMEELLSYLYTGCANLTSQNILPLCTAANYLEVSGLVNECERFLVDSLSPEVVFDRLFYSDDLQLPVLQQEAVLYIHDNCEPVAQSVGKLEQKGLERIIDLCKVTKQKANIGKNISMTEVCFQLVIQWTGSYLERSMTLSSLLRKVPLETMFYENLKELIDKTEVIKSSHPVSRFLVRALGIICHHLDFLSSKSLTKYRLYSLGGLDQNDKALATIEMFNPFTKLWSSIPEMSEARAFFGAAVTGSRIFVCGGLSNGERLNSCEVFDCRASSWEACAAMPSRLWGCAAVILGNFLYLTGGSDSLFNSLSACYRYNLTKDEWSVICPMVKPRRDHQVVEVKGQLYAICGWGSNTIERYDPGSDQWSLLSGTKQSSKPFFGAAVTGSRIYVCGDLFEVYDPETDRWRTLTNSDHPYEGRTLVAMNDKLWAVGGSCIRSGVKPEVLSYDILNEVWTREPDMETGRKNHCSVVVNC